ncbi:MAG TPA: WG repeat-containing protein [Candidatus Angelobacter sp.]|nr:WG repeat-containing protein [Candidatus Angelobacter sp.]
MKKSKKSIAIALVLSVMELTLCSRRAYPQTNQDGWSDLTESLNAGMPLEVDEVNRTKIKGKFVAITPGTLSLWVKDHQVDIDRSEVSRIKKNHANLPKGFALFGGGAALLGVGALWAAAIGSHKTETDADKTASVAAVGTMLAGAATAFVWAPMEVYGHYTIYKAGSPKPLAPAKDKGKPKHPHGNGQLVRSKPLTGEQAPRSAELGGVSSPLGSKSPLEMHAANFGQNRGPAARTLFPIRAGDSWGCINRQGVVVVKPQPSGSDRPTKAGLCGQPGNDAEPPVPKAAFGTLGTFHEGLAMASPGSDTQNGWGEFDGIFPQIYTRVKKGYINTLGRYVIPPQYLDLDQFSEGLAAVRVSRHKWTYIDMTGTRAMPTSYYLAGRFSEGLAPVIISTLWRGNKVGFIDNTGKIVIPPKFDKARPFAEGLARVEISGKWGYIDKSGKMAISLKFDLAGDFSEGLAAVNIGATDELKKEWRSSVNCCMAGEQREDIIVRGMITPGSRLGYGWDVPAFWGDFSAANPWCFVPESGDVSWASEAKSVGGEWGYIDRTGRIIIPPQFSGALKFSGGLAQVFAGGTCSWDQSKSGIWMAPAQKFGYIDEKGKHAWLEAGWPKE